MSAASLLYWFVCAFGSAALAAVPARTPVPALGAAGLGFAAGIWWLSPRQLLPLEAAGVLIAAAAAGALWSSRAAIPAAGIAGLAAAIWASSLQLDGMPPAAAFVLAGAPLLIAGWFAARRPSFAPPAVREEALLIVIVLGLVAAMFPGLREGWRSAAALNAGEAAAVGALPVWIVGLVGGLLGAGGIYTWWRRA